jgi:hypothetical protein
MDGKYCHQRREGVLQYAAIGELGTPPKSTVTQPQKKKFPFLCTASDY